jgi:ion channel-forming bestrophin family protein
MFQGGSWLISSQVGPRDVTRHSKWPCALRMHGSVTSKILLRTIAVGIWAAIITTIHKNVHQSELIVPTVSQLADVV